MTAKALLAPKQVHGWWLWGGQSVVELAWAQMAHGRIDGWMTYWFDVFLSSNGAIVGWSVFIGWTMGVWPVDPEKIVFKIYKVSFCV